MQWKRNAGKEMQEMQWKCDGTIMEIQDKTLLLDSFPREVVPEYGMNAHK